MRVWSQNTGNSESKVDFHVECRYTNFIIKCISVPSVYICFHPICSSVVERALCQASVLTCACVCPSTVSGRRHGRVPRQDAARWRQLPGDPSAAPGDDDPHSRADVTSSAVSPSRSQHGAEFNPERQDLCSSCVQVTSEGEFADHILPRVRLAVKQKPSIVLQPWEIGCLWGERFWGKDWKCKLECLCCYHYRLDQTYAELDFLVFKIFLIINI